MEKRVLRALTHEVLTHHGMVGVMNGSYYTTPRRVIIDVIALHLDLLSIGWMVAQELSNGKVIYKTLDDRISVVAHGRGPDLFTAAY